MQKLDILGDPSRGTTYTDPGAANINHIAIFPPVGIARVGDSDIECFLAPEVPGRTSPPEGLLVNNEFRFRDKHQKLRRQAVRFRVYAYGSDGGVLGELNKKNGYTLEWKVHVANKKAANVVFPRGGRFGPRDPNLRNPTVPPNDSNVDLDKRLKLIVEANEQIPTTAGSDFVLLKGKFQGSQSAAVDVELAQLQLDDAGRLVFVPGKGDARSIASPGKPHPRVISEFDNADWIDEICDGSVSVTVKQGGTVLSKPTTTATVLSAPPKFAWGINAPGTLYDTMENIYREANHPRVPAPTAANLDFWKHIWPVLLSVSSISWTNNTALQGHGPFSNGYFEANSVFELFKGSADGDSEKQAKRKHFKSRIFERLRTPLNEESPDHSQADVRYMPLLSGDAGDMADPGNVPRKLEPDARRFAALTKLQYERFKIWKDDDAFYLNDDATGRPPIPQPKLENIDKIEQPGELTRAILESTIGYSLYPGMEMYWIAKLETTYDTQASVTINPPFRINKSILPGHLTRGLSLPWHCDFDLCSAHWWPSIRLDNVVPKIVFDNTVQNSQVKEDFDTAITTRSKWTRGLRETVFFDYTQTNWPGSDDMIKYWKCLGVVREVKDVFTDDSTPPKKYTAFLEDERVSV